MIPVRTTARSLKRLSGAQSRVIRLARQQRPKCSYDLHHPVHLIDVQSVRVPNLASLIYLIPVRPDRIDNGRWPILWPRSMAGADLNHPGCPNRHQTPARTYLLLTCSGILELMEYSLLASLALVQPQNPAPWTKMHPCNLQVLSSELDWERWTGTRRIS